ISANCGNTFHVTNAAAPPPIVRMAAALPRRTRFRYSHASIASATATLINDAREYDSTSAAKNTAPPAHTDLRETGACAPGRVTATAIITRKNAQKLPSVLAS